MLVIMSERAKCEAFFVFLYLVLVFCYVICFAVSHWARIQNKKSSSSSDDDAAVSEARAALEHERNQVTSLKEENARLQALQVRGLLLGLGFGFKFGVCFGFGVGLWALVCFGLWFLFWFLFWF
jgi:hypothetical protein